MCSLHASLPEPGSGSLCPHGTGFWPRVLGSRSPSGPADLSSIACLLPAPSFSPVSPQPPSCFWSDPPLPRGSDGKASAYKAGDPGSIPGVGRAPGEGNGNHSSILPWRAPRTEEPGGPHTVHGVTKGQPRPSDFTFSFSLPPAFFIHLCCSFQLSLSHSQAQPESCSWTT